MEATIVYAYVGNGAPDFHTESREKNVPSTLAEGAFVSHHTHLD